MDGTFSRPQSYTDTMLLVLDILKAFRMLKICEDGSFTKTAVLTNFQPSSLPFFVGKKALCLEMTAAVKRFRPPF